jgi:hypothetical protein
VPASQFRQVALVLAPIVEEYLPPGHNRQVDDALAPVAVE